MKLDAPEQASLTTLDNDTLGVLTTVLYHFVQRGVEDADLAAGKALRNIIYDPLESLSPEFYATHLELALKSNATLSELFPGFASSEEKTRKYVARLVERIRAGTDEPKLCIDDSAVLPDWVAPVLLKLFLPIKGTLVSDEDKQALAEEIASLDDVEDCKYLYVNAIKLAVRSQVKLTRFTPPGWSEEAIRKYLVDLGRRILEAERAAYIKKYDACMRETGQTPDSPPENRTGRVG